MNRVIKFRGWDGKQFHYFDLDEVFFQGAMNEASGSNQWSPSNLYIQQYTGLHDRNGKEIYEGDIVDFFNKEAEKRQKSEVKYITGCFIPDCWRYDNTIEVIGNKFENPELLK